MTSLNDTANEYDWFTPAAAFTNEEEAVEPFDPERVSRALFVYIAPFLIFGGIVGNTLSFIVLQGKHFRKSPSSVILSALCMADTGALVTPLLRHWIRALTKNALDVRKLSGPGCKVHLTFTAWFRQLSPWTLMLMTIERLISVTLPLKAATILTKTRMFIIWIATAAGLFVISAQFLITYRSFEFSFRTADGFITQYGCEAKPEYWWFRWSVWPWLDYALVSIIPFIVIATVNVLIVCQVGRAQRRRKADMRVEGDRSGDARSITRMLVTVSVVFLLTTTPVGVYFGGYAYWPNETREDDFKGWIAYAATNLVSYVNNSVNFLLYCASGSRFRRALAAMVSRKQQGEPDRSVSTTSSQVSSRKQHVEKSPPVNADTSHI